VHSLQASPGAEVPEDATDNNDPFSLPATQASLVLKHPPKWMRRPVGGVFGFGGKLVTFGKYGGHHSVSIKTTSFEKEMIKRSHELEDTVEKKEFTEFCDKRISSASSKLEKQQWEVIKIIGDKESRKHLVSFLSKIKSRRGSSSIPTEEVPVEKEIQSPKEEVVKPSEEAKKVEEETEKVESPQESSKEVSKEEADTQEDIKEAEPTEESTKEKADDVATVFEKSPQKDQSDDADFFNSIAKVEESDDDIVKVKSPLSQKPFKIYGQDLSDVDQQVTSAIISGDFSSAVDHCIKASRLSDALILATLGDSELLTHTQNYYFAHHGDTSPYLRLVQSILSGNLTDLVVNGDLEEWVDILKMVCTFGKSSETSNLVEILGRRLQEASLSLSSKGDLSEKATELLQCSLICFLVAANLPKAVEIWCCYLKSQEDILEKEYKEQKSKGKRFSFSNHALALQDFIDKVTVFRKLIGFVDSEAVDFAIDDQSDIERKRSSEQLRLSTLYDTYIEYVELLTSHGQMDTAFKYLNLIPDSYVSKRAALSDLKYVQALRERVYQLSQSKEGPSVSFPYEYVEIGGKQETHAQQPQQQQSYAEYVKPAAPTQPATASQSQYGYPPYSYDQQPRYSTPASVPAPVYSAPASVPAPQQPAGYVNPYQPPASIVPSAPAYQSVPRPPSAPGAPPSMITNKPEQGYLEPPVVPKTRPASTASSTSQKGNPIRSPFPNSAAPPQQAFAARPTGFAPPPQQYGAFSQPPSSQGYSQPPAASSFSQAAPPPLQQQPAYNQQFQQNQGPQRPPQPGFSRPPPQQGFQPTSPLHQSQGGFQPPPQQQGFQPPPQQQGFQPPPQQQGFQPPPQQQGFQPPPQQQQSGFQPPQNRPGFQPLHQSTPAQSHPGQPGVTSTAQSPMAQSTQQPPKPATHVVNKHRMSSL
jgi:protein transport protein SEC31